VSSVSNSNKLVLKFSMSKFVAANRAIVAMGVDPSDDT
jgi:hypothetical protein